MEDSEKAHVRFGKVLFYSHSQTWPRQCSSTPLKDFVAIKTPKKMQSPFQWGLEPSLSLCLSSIGTAAPCNFDQCSWMNPNRQFCCIRLLEKSILHGCAPSLFTAFWPLTGLIRLWITTKPLCPTDHGKGRFFSRRF